MTAGDTIIVGKKVVAKYLAIHEQADFVDYGLSRVLALYGLLRLIELSTGIDAYGSVDKKLANMLASGPLAPLPDAHQRMGGLAGAYRFYQGSLKVGERASCLLHTTAQTLAADVAAAPTAERVLAVAPFLAMAAAPLDAPELADAAVQHWRAAAVLRDARTGLFRASATADSSTWCRGNGYAFAALAEVLRYLPYSHSARPGLVQELRTLVDRLALLQTANGMWRNVMDDAGTYLETSGSALITYVLFTAVVEGWLPATYSAIGERAWSGVAQHVNVAGNGNVTNVCPPLAPDASSAAIAAAPPLLNALDGFGPLMLAASAAYAWKRRREWLALPLRSHQFARPTPADVEAYMARLHEICEKAYNGDGSWGPGTAQDPPGTFDSIIKESQTTHAIIRQSGDCASGYLDAVLVRPNAVYRQRAREALDWLVREQEPDGSFRLWTRRDGGQVRHHGCLYDTGIAGSALIKGYERLGDERYLAASARAAAWAAAWPVDGNVNFNAFVVWHMADHYRITHDTAILDAAIYETRQAMIAPQLTNGGWIGHNAWTWYHGISLRAYATLLRALPPAHEFAPILAASIDAAVRYLLDLQAENGSICPNAEHRGLSAEHMAHQITALAAVCAVRPDPLVRSALDGLVAYRISPESGDPDNSYNNEQRVVNTGNAPGYLFALGAYLRLCAGGTR